MNETWDITLRVTADPETFRGGDGHPSTLLIVRLRDELTNALEELGVTVDDVTGKQINPATTKGD